MSGRDTSPRGRLLAGAWTPPGLWALFLFAGSSFPIGTGRILFPGADKVVHGVEFAVLGLLLARALLRTRPGLPPLRAALLGAVIAAAYGITDEIHQAFVPEREASVEDWAADAAGSLLGAGCILPFVRRRDAAPGVSAPRGS